MLLTEMKVGNLMAQTAALKHTRFIWDRLHDVGVKVTLKSILIGKQSQETW